MARQRKFQLIILRQGLHEQNIQLIVAEAERQHVPLKFVSAEEIEAMAHGKTHGGILALCTPKPATPVERLMEQIKSGQRSVAMILLEGVDDAQNLGFTVRSAEALGIDAILLKKHLWDFDGTAVSRASSGAFERLPVVLVDQVDKIIPKFRQLGLQTWGCIANAKRTMYQVDLTQPTILAIGGEKRGLSAAVREQCEGFIKIPMLSEIGSLSLSHSASILMAEVMRQRIAEQA